jgi:hypothetical protein
MKQIKNITLAILSGLLILSVATVSCSKKSSSPSSANTPTISGVTPTTGITIGTVITINGTNFTGATVTIGGVAATNVGIGLTAITATVPAGVTPGSSVAVVVTTSAGSVTYDITVLAAALPPIDGYKTADSVAHSFLQAYFPFDGNATEKISSKGTLVAHTGDSYATGKVGQALVLSNGYVIADSTIPNFNGTTATDNYQNYSVSLWVNQNSSINATNSGGGTYSPLFQLSGAQYGNIWGLFGVIISNSGLGGDSLAVGGEETQIDATDHNYNYAIDPRTTSSQYVAGNSGWHHVVLTYTGPAVTARIYVDGVKIFTGDSAAMATATNIAPPVTFNIGAGGGPKVPTFGTAAFSDDFTVDYGWGAHYFTAASHPWAAHGMTCSLDEIRVYNTALTDAEAKALYDFGVAGR